MNLEKFSKEDQRKSICFWYEGNCKGQKYVKKVTWREFYGKCYIKTYFPYFWPLYFTSYQKYIDFSKFMFLLCILLKSPLWLQFHKFFKNCYFYEKIYFMAALIC